MGSTMDRATVVTISAEQSNPVLIALIGKFEHSKSICFRTVLIGTGSIRATLPGVSATTHVTAVRP